MTHKHPNTRTQTIHLFEDIRLHAAEVVLVFDAQVGDEEEVLPRVVLLLDVLVESCDEEEVLLRAVVLLLLYVPVEP